MALVIYNNDIMTDRTLHRKKKKEREREKEIDR